MAYHHVSIKRPALIALALAVAASWRHAGEAEASRKYVAEARRLRIVVEHARAEAAGRRLDATLSAVSDAVGAVK